MDITCETHSGWSHIWTLPSQILSLVNHVITLSLPGMAVYLPYQGSCLACLLQRMPWIQWTFLHWNPNK